jgi:hypothetical protein
LNSNLETSSGVRLLGRRFSFYMLVPLNVVAAFDDINLSWEGDGFRLRGAETVDGPWYDLGVSSPVNLPANCTLRVFRLLCD